MTSEREIGVGISRHFTLPAMIRPDHRKAVLVECALPGALEAVGERWSFLILRGAFNGLAHFEEFQSTLGIARNILSNRLARLVEHEILQRQPDAADRRKVLLALTPKGRRLLTKLSTAHIEELRRIRPVFADLLERLDD